MPTKSARQIKINAFMRLFFYLAVFAPFGLFILFCVCFFRVFPKVYISSFCLYTFLPLLYNQKCMFYFVPQGFAAELIHRGLWAHNKICEIHATIAYRHEK